MIDLDILEFSLGVAESSGDETTAIYCASLRELITSLREAERDAARYRWLRESASLENHGGFEYDLPLIHAVIYMDGAELNQEMTFDEAIDQAMKEKGDE